MSGPRVPILELDGDLADAVAPDERAVATRYATAPVVGREPGPWPSDDLVIEPGTLGLLVIEGLLTRQATVSGRTAGELLGEGDILRPWDQDGGGTRVPVQWRWTVLQPLRFAILDERFGQVVSRWPALLDALVCRAMRRSRGLGFQLALTQVKRVDERLELLLWTLAERWGRVGPDGVLLPVRLTHETLAMLVGAQRPTVTTALNALVRDGRLARHEHGWMLLGTPAETSAF